MGKGGAHENRREIHVVEERGGEGRRDRKREELRMKLTKLCYYVRV